MSVQYTYPNALGGVKIRRNGITVLKSNGDGCDTIHLWVEKNKNKLKEGDLIAFWNVATPIGVSKWPYYIWPDMKEKRFVWRF